MNDEIKEILYLEKYIDKYKSDEKSIINGNRLTTPAMLDYLEVKDLLDYITNLQQDRDDLDDYNRHLHQENERLKELDENYPIEEELAEAYRREEDYKSRIEKTTKDLFELKDMIYKPETRDENIPIQQKISSIIKQLNGRSDE